MLAHRLDAIHKRLKDPAMSYNRHFDDGTFPQETNASRSFELLLMLAMMATADYSRLGRLTILTRKGFDVRQDITEEQMNSATHIRVRGFENGLTISMGVTIALTLHFANILVTICDQANAATSAEAATVYMALDVFSRLLLIEVQERECFDGLGVCNPFRGHPLLLFGPSQEQGYDCPICQDDIGETERVYALRCLHQFHR